MATVANGEPVKVDQLFRVLVEALKRLSDLTRVVREAEAPPEDGPRLARQLQETVCEIRALQRQLLRAKLTPAQQKEIRELMAGGGSLRQE